jgi:hypothetical protein
MSECIIIRVFWWLMPLSKTVFHIHLFYLPQVLGPMANNSQELFGDYTPNSNPIYIVTPLEGLGKLAGNVTYAPGCNDGNKCSNYSANDIQNAVKDVTVIFVCLGTGKCKTIIKQIAMFYILL